MDLELILKEKAAAKAKETRLAQELIERQEEEEQARAEAERVAAESREEEGRINEIRATVISFDEQISKTRELLKELTEIHEDVKGAVESLAEQRKQHAEAVQAVEHMFADETFRAVLQDEGINSVAELLAAEGFAETDQIRAVVEGKTQIQSGKEIIKEKIGERVRARQEAEATLGEEKPEIALMYNELIGGLEDRIVDLEAKRKEAYWQTPEGEEAKQEELKEIVKQKIDKEFPDYAFYKFWDRPKYHPPKFKAIELAVEVVQRDLRELSEEAQVYGVEDLKRVLVAVVTEKIEGELETEYKKEGSNKLREKTLENLEHLEVQWQEFKTIAPELIQQAQEIKKKLTDYLDLPAGESTKQELAEYYGLRKDVSAEGVVRRILESASALEWESQGHNNEQFGFVEEAISVPEYFTIILDSFSEFSSSPNFSGSAYETLRGSNKKTPNPEFLLKTAKRQKEIYDSIEAFIETSDTGIDQLMEGIQGSSLASMSFGLEPVEKGSELPPTKARLKEEIQQERSKLEATKEAAKQQFENAFADEVAIRQYHNFRNEQQAAISRIDTFENQSHFAQEVLPTLDTNTVGLDGNERFELVKGFVNYEEYEADFEAVSSGFAQNTQELAAIRKGIEAVNRRARTEGDGFLNSKRRQREKEVAEFVLQEQQNQQEVSELEEKSRNVKAKLERFDKLRRATLSFKQAGIDVALPASGIVQELLDLLKETLQKIELSEEDVEVRTQLSKLAAANEFAEERTEQTRGW